MAKVMISIPDELLKRVDARARKRKLSRSGFLRLAAEHELARPTRAEIDKALAEGQKLLADVGPFDAAKLIREDRDTR
jgi:metal-responsive CopG/Arc/MetJ family transcriptional regulator